MVLRLSVCRILFNLYKSSRSLINLSSLSVTDYYTGDTETKIITYSLIRVLYSVHTSLYPPENKRETEL